MSDLLASASLISVSIGGNFPVTGSYSASVNERVDQFVTRIYDKAFSLALGNSPSQEKINSIQQEFQMACKEELRFSETTRADSLDAAGSKAHSTNLQPKPLVATRIHVTASRAAPEQIRTVFTDILGASRLLEKSVFFRV